jgi:hypothetical protein
MLTLRTGLLTATGLLTGYLAAGQSTSPAAADQGSDILFWLLAGVLGIVLLMVLVTGSSLALATRRHHQTGLESSEQTSSTQAEEGSATC